MKTPRTAPSLPPETVACDLLVAGGGIGGVVTALAAARHGCTVALVHDRPVLGGNASSEINVMIAGANAMGYNKDARETGIIEEILVENQARSPDSSCRLLDDILWEWLEREPNVTLYLNAQVTGVEKDAEGRIAAVRALRESGRELVARCRWAADCTGDAVVAHEAGAAWRMGREAKAEFGESLAPDVADHKVLGCTLPFQFKDTGRPVKFVPPAFARDFSSPDAFPHRDHHKLKWSPWWTEWGGELDMIHQTQEIKEELTRIVYGMWDHLKNHGDHGMENHALVRISPILGKRESRRVEGPHMLTQNDVTERRAFPDAVAYGGWPIDLHPPEGIDYPGHPAEQTFIDPYEIPLRCLYSRDVPNLFLVGRDISATHVALGTTRVMATIATMGQAVGTAAGICRRDGVDPGALGPARIAELQQTLLRDDATLLRQRNEDPCDLACGAAAAATSDAPLQVAEGETWEPLASGRAQLFPVTAGRLDALHLLLRNQEAAPRRVTAVLRRAAHLFDFSPSAPVAEAAASVAPGEAWTAFPFARELRLPRGLYWVELSREAGLSWRLTRREEPSGTKTAQRGADGAWEAYRGRHVVETAEWVNFRGAHAFRLDPPSRPHTADQAVNGANRPGDWPNLWVSDPALPLPQSLSVAFGREVPLGEVLLAFDTDLDHRVPPRFSPRVVRDYRLWARLGGKEELVAEVAGNHHRRRRHDGGGRRADGLRLEVAATHGSPSARVYEIRAYAQT